MNTSGIVLDPAFNILEFMLELVTMFLGLAEVVLDVLDAEQTLPNDVEIVVEELREREGYVRVESEGYGILQVDCGEQFRDGH